MKPLSVWVVSYSVYIEVWDGYGPSRNEHVTEEFQTEESARKRAAEVNGRVYEKQIPV